MHELSPGAPGVEGRLTGAGTQGSAAELEASAWGRGAGTRACAEAGPEAAPWALWTGPRRGLAPGRGAYAGRSGAGPRPERALLCSADSSRFFRERVLF